MHLTLKVWRQAGPSAAGSFKTYQADDVSPDMSFLELLDDVNESLIERGEEPIAFDHDCREGICGTCSLVINGVAHGPMRATTVCQLHMRHFHDGQSVVVEPWRAGAFPVLRDLVVDRSAFDRIIQAGGYITAPTGAAQDANGMLVGKEQADQAMDSAAVHRLRCVRGGVPERLGLPLHRGQDQPPGAAAAGAAGAVSAGPGDGPPDGCRRVRWMQQLWRV